MTNNKPKPQDILWENVSALMKRDYGKENLTKLGEEANIGGSNSRIKKRDTSIGLNVLLKVANHFGVETWQLLLPGLNDVKFLDVLRAWQHTDERGRRMILRAAEGAVEKDEPGPQQPERKSAHR